MGKSKGFIRRTLKLAQLPFKNWDWKAVGICFLTACTFWIFNALNSNHSANLSYPIRLEYDRSSLCLLTPPPSYIKVNVTGYGWNLLRKSLGIGIKTITVPLNSYKQQYLTSQNMGNLLTESLHDLQVNYLLEDSLFFKADTLEVRFLPIAVSEEDLTLAQGVKPVSNIMSTPNQLKVKGPPSLLDLPPYSATVQLKVPKDSIRSHFSQQVAVDLPAHPHITFDSTVQLRFQVEQFEKDTVMASLQLRGFPSGKSIKLRPSAAQLIYWRKPNTSPMPAGLPSIIIDYKNMNFMDSTITPTLKLSKKYAEPTCSPKQFKVFMQ